MNAPLRMLVVLSTIAIVSGAALGGLHEATSERAENNVLKFKKIPAVVDLYGLVEGDVSEERRLELQAELLAEKRFLELENEDPALFFVVKKDGEPYALTLEDYGQGFGGKVGVMVGFRLDAEQLLGIGVTTLSETPGVGTRVRDKDFTGQFTGMARLGSVQLAKDGGTVDGISGATISSRAVAAAVSAAEARFREHGDAMRELASRPPPAAEETGGQS